MIEDQAAIRTFYAHAAQHAIAEAAAGIAAGLSRTEDPNSAYWVIAHHRQMAIGYSTLANLPSDIELEPVNDTNPPPHPVWKEAHRLEGQEVLNPVTGASLGVVVSGEGVRASEVIEERQQQKGDHD